MGFLDNTTNNIILDAVLTDKGREFLARNDGSFSIYQFALADDEVNYGWIKKYGKTIGREKIIKNTPIFEALTNQNSSLKYKLISSSSPNLTYLPSLELIGNASSYDVYLNSSSSTQSSMGTSIIDVSIEQMIGSSNSIHPSLKDLQFIIEINNLFLELTNGSLHSLDKNNKATYRLMPTGVNTLNGSKTTLKLRAAQSLTTQMFEFYGKDGTINTSVRISGLQSGSVIDIPIKVKLYQTRTVAPSY